jgi:hypothetical protein
VNNLSVLYRILYLEAYDLEANHGGVSRLCLAVGSSSNSPLIITVFYKITSSEKIVLFQPKH